MPSGLTKRILVAGSVAGAIVAVGGAVAMIAPPVIKIAESQPPPFAGKMPLEQLAADFKDYKQAEAARNAQIEQGLALTSLSLMTMTYQADKADQQKNPKSESAKKVVCGDLNQLNPLRQRAGITPIPMPEFCQEAP